MPVLTPGVTTVDVLPVVGPDGVPAVPDSGPTLAEFRNGGSASIATIGDMISTGIYSVTIVTPSGWAPGDVYTIIPSVVFDGVTYFGEATTYQVIPAVDVKRILATALTESGSGRLASAFKTFFDVASPTGTVNLIQADLVRIMNTLLTQGGAGRLAAALSMFLDVATPTGTVNLVDANIKKVDGETIQGAGTTNDPWRPV
jgi:hypothetical protein